MGRAYEGGPGETIEQRIGTFPKYQHPGYTRNVAFSLASGAAFAAVVSYALAFLSGMEARKRILTNLATVALAVGVTYILGTLTKSFLGVTL